MSFPRRRLKSPGRSWEKTAGRKVDEPMPVVAMKKKRRLKTAEVAVEEVKPAVKKAADSDSDSDEEPKVVPEKKKAVAAPAKSAKKPVETKKVTKRAADDSDSDEQPAKKATKN